MIVKISNPKDLRKITPDIEAIYLQRQPSLFFLNQIFNNLKKIKKIYLSPSTFQRTGKKAKTLLKEKSISLIVSEFKGKPIISPSSLLSKINEYKRDSLSIRKIAEKTNLPKSTIHYLFKYAKKNKIKKDNIVIILKKAEVIE